jgi:hypothetical protein
MVQVSANVLASVVGLGPPTSKLALNKWRLFVIGLRKITIACRMMTYVFVLCVGDIRDVNF